MLRQVAAIILPIHTRYFETALAAVAKPNPNRIGYATEGLSVAVSPGFETRFIVHAGISEFRVVHKLLEVTTFLKAHDSHKHWVFPQDLQLFDKPNP